jgi:hypothetical protein
MTKPLFIEQGALHLSDNQLESLRARLLSVEVGAISLGIPSDSAIIPCAAVPLTVERIAILDALASTGAILIGPWIIQESLAADPIDLCSRIATMQTRFQSVLVRQGQL